MSEVKKTVASMFPTYVWIIELPDELTQSINRSVLPLIERKLGSNPQSSEKSLYLQTEQNLHLEPEFAELAKYIHTYADSALKFLNVDYENIQITGCWANISGIGNTHREHAHPNNFLSGVYYVETHPGGNSIVFHDPRPQASVMKPRVKQMTLENTDHAIVEVAPGNMLLFPSWLRHSVPANQSSHRRISVAFNLMFQQFAETMSSPFWKASLDKS